MEADAYLHSSHRSSRHPNTFLLRRHARGAWAHLFARRDDSPICYAFTITTALAILTVRSYTWRLSFGAHNFEHTTPTSARSDTFLSHVYDRYRVQGRTPQGRVRASIPDLQQLTNIQCAVSRPQLFPRLYLRCRHALMLLIRLCMMTGNLTAAAAAAPPCIAATTAMYYMPSYAAASGGLVNTGLFFMAVKGVTFGRVRGLLARGAVGYVIRVIVPDAWSRQERRTLRMGGYKVVS